MASGILDAMAKRIEIQNGRPSISLADTPVDLFSAYRMAEYTYEALSQYALQAMEDVRQHKVTKAVEDVTFINMAVTGMLSNTTRSFKQSALAHAVDYAIRTYFPQESKNALHGEAVAVGLFLQTTSSRPPASVRTPPAAPASTRLCGSCAEALATHRKMVYTTLSAICAKERSFL